MMLNIFYKFKNILSLSFLKRRWIGYYIRNPLTLIEYDQNSILRMCSFNENFISDLELIIIQNQINQKNLIKKKPGENHNHMKHKSRINPREDFVDTKNYLIFLKNAKDKIESSRNKIKVDENLVYNYISAFLEKENSCEDIIHFLECHPTAYNFNLFFKFFQINNEISIIDNENHQKYKELINSNLNKFDFFNIINLKQMLSLNKKMNNRFPLDILSMKIDKKKLNSIFLEKLFSNKYNISKCLKEGGDLVNFLLELLKLDIKNDKFWKLAKRIYIKLSSDDRLNLQERIFILNIFSLKNIGSKIFYQNQIELIKSYMIREIISAEFKKIEIKLERFEFLLNVMICFFFNLKVIHNIKIVTEYKSFCKNFLKFITIVKESLVKTNTNEESMKRIDRLINEIKFIIGKNQGIEEINSSFFYNYYSLIKINSNCDSNDETKEKIQNVTKNFKCCYNELIQDKNFLSYEKIFVDYLLQLNFEVLNEFVKYNENNLSIIDDKFFLIIIDNIFREYLLKKEQFEVKYKQINTQQEEKESNKKLEKLKFILIKIHNILAPNSYFNNNKLKERFLIEARNLILSNLSEDKHLKHLNKIHQELIKSDKKYIEALQDLKMWENYNKSY